MHYVEFGAPSRIKTNLMKKVLEMGNSGKSYSTVLSRAHLWCVSLVFGLWCVSVCAILGVVIAHCGKLMKLWLCVAVPQRAWGCTVAILAEYWHTSPRVLVHCPRELAEYSKSTATVLPGYWCSTPRIQAHHP